MKPIIEYTDYRDFLKERFQWMKGEKRSTSLETVARKIGLSKPFLTLVLNKKRHMSLDSVAHLEAGFKLTPQEREYLIFLICHNVISDSSTKDFFGVVLRRLRALFTQKVEPMNWQSYESNPFIPLSIHELILSLAEMGNFKMDADWILSQISLKIPKEIIVAAMEEIEAQGGVEKFLRKNSDIPYTVFHHPTKVSASKVAAAGLSSQALYISSNDPQMPHSWMSGFVIIDDADVSELHSLQSEYVNKVIELMKKAKQPTELYSFVASSMRIKK